MTFTRKLVLFIACLALSRLVGTLAFRFGTEQAVMRWFGYFMLASGLLLPFVPRGNLRLVSVVPLAIAFSVHGAAVSGILPIPVLVTNFLLLGGVLMYVYLSRGPAGRAPTR